MVSSTAWTDREPVLRPVARWAVQLFTRLITENHVARLVTNLDRLYERRAAWCASGTPEAAGEAARQCYGQSVKTS